ncbi:MAG: hypothetical protein QXW94_03060 [Desulfurococcaceae archaeon]
MIKAGKILFIGDEFLELIALAAGIDAYLFNDDCKALLEWLNSNIQKYDVVVYLDVVKEKCEAVEDFMKRFARNKIALMIEHPIKHPAVDPKKYYREVARKILGIEISI